MKIRQYFAALAIALVAASGAYAQTTSGENQDISDAALVKNLPGFTDNFATVNGIRLHYVAGGEGKPLVLLPGWPETWWSYHKIMPELAKHYRVISVDMRGMGSSDKPADGFDKKTMASDISELVTQLGYKSADIVGHDIGAMVAFSFAANHPEQTHKLVLLDVGHPSAGYMKLSLLPQPGSFNDQVDEDNVYLWWFAFHQVKGLPEKLMEGREHLEQEWFFHYMAKDESAIDATDRAVYAAAYGSSDAIRASNGWYQAFLQDIADDAKYGKLSMPVLGLGGPGYKRLKASLDDRAPGSTTIHVEGSGHFIAEEKPDALIGYLKDFLK
ncbi:pimeloyl-ACP methyl ester carboxylesterase [Phyllobacterium sp. 1468]|uniref:alpha/beta fold hydrolase n=1 Tax=Phyllobacterium sp. 1468 TaxID=2817759 RepID=UPI00285B4BB7|nr:alpha/beta hydrolase [Phyllobacterium sp. 1468]MDR6632645.1 pimeloyl-ACP methyl ester carboxylesterase [Phyllobacterium sp. 1468]